jgi:hypothetical protein
MGHIPETYNLDTALKTSALTSTYHMRNSNSPPYLSEKSLGKSQNQSGDSGKKKNPGTSQ